MPGDVSLDLSRNGELPADLFYGENITSLRPYELYERWYQRGFHTPAGIAGRRIEPRFHGVDCLATYWLDGTKLGETADALVEQSFDVAGNSNATRPNIQTISVRSPSLRPPASVMILSTPFLASRIRREPGLGSRRTATDETSGRKPCRRASGAR